MGFFSFVGKALKSVVGVAKIVAPLAIGGPIGAAAGALAGGTIFGKGKVGSRLNLLSNQLLSSKSPMSTSPLKINVLGSSRSIPILRAKAAVSPSTARVASNSPVMPGGSIATAQGIMAPGGGVPPSHYGGSRSSGKRRKRRSTSSRRSSRARSSRKRRGGKRRLKFGSPAYRKKYLGHR